MLLTALERLKAAFEAGFDAGFDESGEGWNGEYPFGSSAMTADDRRKHNERYQKARLAALQAWTKEEY
jgi:hypothetical protein